MAGGGRLALPMDSVSTALRRSSWLMTWRCSFAASSAAMLMMFASPAPVYPFVWNAISCGTTPADVKGDYVDVKGNYVDVKGTLNIPLELRTMLSGLVPAAPPVRADAIMVPIILLL